MSAGQVTFGHEVSIQFDGFAVSHTGGEIAFTGQAHDVGSTEEGDREKQRVGLKGCRIRLRGLVAKDFNPHTGGLTGNEGNIGERIGLIEVFVNGIANDPYQLLDVEVITFNAAFDRPNPNNFNFEGAPWDWVYPSA